MNDTLRAILDTDKKAQEQLRSAESYRQERMSTLTDRKMSVAKQAAFDASERARRDSEKELKAGESILADREKDSAKIKLQMDKLFEQNRDSWVDAIFREVTGI